MFVPRSNGSPLRFPLPPPTHDRRGAEFLRERVSRDALADLPSRTHGEYLYARYFSSHDRDPWTGGGARARNKEKNEPAREGRGPGWGDGRGGEKEKKKVIIIIIIIIFASLRVGYTHTPETAVWGGNRQRGFVRGEPPPPSVQ